MEGIEINDHGEVVTEEFGTVNPEDVNFGFDQGEARVTIGSTVIQAFDPSNEDEFAEFQKVQKRVAEATEPEIGSADYLANKAMEIASSNSQQLSDIANMFAEQWKDMRQAKEQAKRVKKEMIETRNRIEQAVSNGELTVKHTVGDVEAPELNGMIHKKQPQLIRTLQAGMHVLMVGGAGTGKTTAARKAARAMGIGFYKFQGHKHAVADDLFGFISAANGEYVPGEAWEPVTEGGLLFIDELDVCTPSLVKACNSLTDDSDIVQFPHETVTKHEDFIVCAAANTIGQGASELYTGASGQLDASSLDRLVYIDWPIDEQIEEELVMAYESNLGPEWLQTVRDVREAVEDRGILLEITPRASIKGAKLLSAGFDMDVVERMVLTNRMSRDQKRELSDVLDEAESGSEEVVPAEIHEREIQGDREVGDRIDMDGRVAELIDDAEDMASKEDDGRNYGVVAQDVRDGTDEMEAAWAIAECHEEDITIQDARDMLDQLPVLVTRATRSQDGKERGELMEKAGILVGIG